MSALNLVHTVAQPSDSPESRRAKAMAIRRLAAKINKFQPPKVQSARVLLSAMRHDRPDHIALAIGAHRLLLSVVLEDLRYIGQTEPAQAHLLSALCSYLDNEGWNVGADGRFYPGYQPLGLG